MQFSHSRLETFKSCPYKYKLRYLDKIEVLPPDNADNALILGTALHTGIEHGLDAAIAEYYNSFPIITDDHVNEAIKLEYIIPRMQGIIPDNGIFETKILKPDFIGFADLIVPVGNNEFDLYDFKYSNHAVHYKQSVQLHVYKYFLEPAYKIRNMFFLIVPKVNIRQKKTEDLMQFRERIKDELKKIKGEVIPVEFDYRKVIDFLIGIKHVYETTEFEKNTSPLCNWCDYNQHCNKPEENDYMILPENKRRTLEGVGKIKLWLYGAPFSGKTTFANNFPDPIMLNTDGNVSFVDAPVIPIKNEIEMDGRLKKETFAWNVFKDAISELEKKQNGFKTVIVDLLEDMYEYCRLYMYKELGIKHESDDSFKAWDKVRTEFLSTIKRLMNLDYETIILISHEDTSKDITSKIGKITAIKPNIQEKIANKVAGMVDLVGRVIAEDGDRTLSFKTSEVVFGGGRLKVARNEIPLEYGEFQKMYKAGAQSTGSRTRESKPVETAKTNESPAASESQTAQASTQETNNNVPEAQASEQNTNNDAPVRTRRRRGE